MRLREIARALDLVAAPHAPAASLVQVTNFVNNPGADLGR